MRRLYVVTAVTVGPGTVLVVSTVFVETTVEPVNVEVLLRVSVVS